eukprot:TRINITY_DN358_c0_g1_i1.p1 TRINITY_DN358_c0_g1~~TRINITY_DN358_c0_g1_i1.p1  ORF type:complete len:325 (-),score=58.73 TRINITY_DN358_c0_g1_i1:1753-2727(-)
MFQYFYDSDDESSVLSYEESEETNESNSISQDYCCESFYNNCVTLLKNGFLPQEADIAQICKDIGSVFIEEPNLLTVDGSVTVVGDIHGQANDLLNIFKLCGNPSSTKYLFMGDYVDRGTSSIEVVILLFCLKLLYPENIWLLRGNHEDPDLNIVYGFADNCVQKFGNLSIWSLVNKVFALMPVSAILNKRAFCAHGGISPNVKNLGIIEESNRFSSGILPDPLRDLLWSDPSDDIDLFSVSPRGAGFLWGKEATLDFLKETKLEIIIRAHEVAMDGYHLHHDNRVLTIFSAANYCNRYGNKGAVLQITESFEFNIITFNPVKT